MTGSQNNTILQIKEVTKTYKTKGSFFGTASGTVTALNNLSLKISSGEIFGLVGESGSGKTTCGRLIVRLEKPEEGEIFLRSMEVTGLKSRALKEYHRKVQMIFQDPYQSLNPQLSIFQSISEPLTIHKIGNKAERFERVVNTLRNVGLSPPEEFIYRYPHQLSGGQRQRVAIARAMVLEPDLVVADEPTSMLDASYSAQIFKILLKMREEFGVTILFITHSLAAARYLCDFIAVIYKGNLMEVGPANEVIQNPIHPYTQALIDAIPKFGHCGEVTRYNTFLQGEREAVQLTGCPFFSRCNRAQVKKCSKENPALIRIAEDHFAACFYLDSVDGSDPDNQVCYLGT